jgi:hypothetical protein
MAFSVKYDGREIAHPIVRLFAICVLLPIGLFMTVIGLMVLIAVAFFAVPLDLLLRIFGRRGFMTVDEKGDYSYNVTADGFRPKLTQK